MRRDLVLTAVNCGLSTLPDSDKEEIRSELANHLDDKAAALRAQGTPAANVETAASAAFGDPSEIAARLTDIHRPPSLWLTLAAILPFIMNGIFFPVIVLIAATQDALGPSAHVPLPVLNMYVVHEESQVWLAAIATGYGRHHFRRGDRWSTAEPATLVGVMAGQYARRRDLPCQAEHGRTTGIL